MNWSATRSVLVHGDLVMFTRGGGPADRELLVTALQGGDLREAAEQAGGTTRLRSAGSIQRRQVR